jgi:Gram-negative porin
MKKTLLALAVVAASGAAFAQSATLSGSYAFGYETTKIGGVKTGGFGTDTAAIKLVATEDLGGGLKASAQVSLGGMMRDGAGTGEDASLTLAGGFGTVTMGTIESDDGLARARVGAPGYGLDGKVHSANANIDVIGYTSPQLAPGLTVGVSYVDRGSDKATGLNAGTNGVAAAQPSVTANVSYAAGPISARFDVTSWTRQSAADVTSNTLKQRFRVSGNYNLGVAKVGLGYAQRTNVNSTKVKDLVAGVSAGFGATTLGLVYESRDNNGAKTTGFSTGASYALSKRTTIDAHYASWKKTGASADTGFRVLVGHSF